MREIVEKGKVDVVVGIVIVVVVAAIVAEREKSDGHKKRERAATNWRKAYNATALALIGLFK